MAPLDRPKAPGGAVLGGLPQSLRVTEGHPAWMPEILDGYDGVRAMGAAEGDPPEGAPARPRRRLPPGHASRRGRSHPPAGLYRVLKNPRLPRLRKKVQMQGGARGAGTRRRRVGGVLGPYIAAPPEPGGTHRGWVSADGPFQQAGKQ